VNPSSNHFARSSIAGGSSHASSPHPLPGLIGLIGFAGLAPPLLFDLPGPKLAPLDLLAAPTKFPFPLLPPLALKAESMPLDLLALTLLLLLLFSLMFKVEESLDDLLPLPLAVITLL
jgi:hypothetical protein